MALQSITKIETLIINTTSASHLYGYIRPRGKTLAAGATALIQGDIRAKMTDRELTALDNDVANGYIAYFVNQRCLVSIPGKTASAIAVGDAVFLDTNQASPAADFTWDTDIATTRGNFANSFLGISQTAKGAGTAGSIFVDISPTSVHKFACTSETHEIGATLAMVKASGNALVNASLVKVGTASQCTFRCVRRDPSAATVVLVNCQSAYFGNNDAAAQ